MRARESKRIVKLTVTICETNGKSAGFRLAIADVGSSIPDPAAVATNIWGKLHVRDD